MKLRIRSNSLRLRLGPREVEQLLRDGVVEETTRFGPGTGPLLRYRLILDRDATRMSAHLGSTGIVVSLPGAQARQWAGGDELSLRGEQDVGGGDVLGLLVEKDLQCRESVSGPEQDVYPNPSDPCGAEPAALPATARV